MKHVKLLLVLMCLMALNAQAQTKFCNSYAEYKTNQWKPYADLIPEKEPDSIRVKYDGQDFTLKTSDKEVNKVIKHDVFMMQIDKQLFINQRFLRLLATGHTTWGSIFLATDLLLTNDDLMQHHILYLVDKAPNEKGKYVMTRLNDAFMEQLLRDDPVTFEQYYGRQKKGDRQSAANILPILVKKGLIQDYHHKK